MTRFLHFFLSLVALFLIFSPEMQATGHEIVYSSHEQESIEVPIPISGGVLNTYEPFTGQIQLEGGRYLLTYTFEGKTSDTDTYTLYFLTSSYGDTSFNHTAGDYFLDFSCPSMWINLVFFEDIGNCKWRLYKVIDI